MWFSAGAKGWESSSVSHRAPTSIHVLNEVVLLAFLSMNIVSQSRARVMPDVEQALSLFFVDF